MDWMPVANVAFTCGQSGSGDGQVLGQRLRLPCRHIGASVHEGICAAASALLSRGRGIATQRVLREDRSDLPDLVDLGLAAVALEIDSLANARAAEDIAVRRLGGSATPSRPDAACRTPSCRPSSWRSYPARAKIPSRAARISDTMGSSPIVRGAYEGNGLSRLIVSLHQLRQSSETRPYRICPEAQAKVPAQQARSRASSRESFTVGGIIPRQRDRKRSTGEHIDSRATEDSSPLERATGYVSDRTTPKR